LRRKRGNDSEKAGSYLVGNLRILQRKPAATLGFLMPITGRQHQGGELCPGVRGAPSGPFEIVAWSLIQPAPVQGHSPPVNKESSTFGALSNSKGFQTSVPYPPRPGITSLGKYVVAVECWDVDQILVEKIGPLSPSNMGNHSIEKGRFWEFDPPLASVSLDVWSFRALRPGTQPG